MDTFKKTLILLILTFCFVPMVKSEVNDLPKITPDNLDSLYDSTVTRFNEIEETTPPLLLKKFKNFKGNTHIRLTNEQNLIRKDYKKLLEHKSKLEPIHNLKKDIVDLYLEFYNEQIFDRSKLNHEASVLAVGLFEEIARLKKKYKSIFIPIFHNMMIDVGVRKRGACKHWAEDLLTYMTPIKRDFFYIAWGEANMQKITEHNVAVIFPIGRSFDEGMMIDPWRTSGKPFWIKLKDDKHYHWQQWSQFGVH